MSLTVNLQCLSLKELSVKYDATTTVGMLKEQVSKACKVAQDNLCVLLYNHGSRTEVVYSNSKEDTHLSNGRDNQLSIRVVNNNEKLEFLTRKIEPKVSVNWIGQCKLTTTKIFEPSIFIVRYIK